MATAEALLSSIARRSVELNEQVLDVLRSRR